MYSQEEFRDAVLGLQAEYKKSLPASFYEDVAQPWFDEIFPVKNEIYGVEGLQRLGPTHAVAEFAGCFYRWWRMVDMEYTLTFDAMLNAMHDAFGYSVIMRVMADSIVQWKTADATRSPMRDLGILLDLYWDDRAPVDAAACTMAVRISINMYRRTPGA
jgi:hypothetical protein